MEFLDTSSLFLHVLAAAGMVGGGLMQVLAGHRLRGATTAGAVREWAGFVRTAGLVVLGSAVVSLLTGGHLAGAVWTTESTSGFSYPFISLGVAGLVLLAPIGPMLGGRALRTVLGDLPADQDRPVTAAVAQDIRATSLWGPVHSLVGVAVGLVALMVYKPGWAVGTAILLVTFGAGWAAGALSVRGTATADHGLLDGNQGSADDQPERR